MAKLYDYNGNPIDVGGTGGGGTTTPVPTSFVKGVNHRGYYTAPENTLPAYRLSKVMGFKMVECDVSFTSDGVPVLLHDATIDRTSNGSGNIGEMTFEQVRQYDFGSWKNESYAGTKIPTLEEFVVLCRNLGLHAYIEIKSNEPYTDEQIQMIVDIVNSYGMRGNVTYISFLKNHLVRVKNNDERARLGYVISTMGTTKANEAVSLRTAYNDVFVDVEYKASTIENTIAIAKEYKLPLELWTIDSAPTILALEGYVSGVTSNKVDATTLYY